MSFIAGIVLGIILTLVLMTQPILPCKYAHLVHIGNQSLRCKP